MRKRQTNKGRPITPLLPTLAGWFQHRNTRYPVMWGGVPIVEINDAVRTIVRPMGVPAFTRAAAKPPSPLSTILKRAAVARFALPNRSHKRL